MKRFSFAACFAVAVGVANSAQAGLITNSPELPVLGFPYTSTTGAGCFPLAGVCVSPGNITSTSLVSNHFNANVEKIITNVSYTGFLTTLANVPIGPINLFGTMEQELNGRTFATELGTWDTELLSLSLSGLVLGHTLTLSLDKPPPSTGVTSIEQLGPNKFRIDSFFDIFVQLDLDTNPPLHTTRGPLHATLAPTAVPEPGTLGLLALGLLGFGFMRHRRSLSGRAPAL